MKILKQLIPAAILSITTLVASVSSSAAQSPTDAGVTLESLRERLQSGAQPESLLFFSTAERRVAFGHMDQLFSTRQVDASPTPYPLSEHPDDLIGLTYQVDGKSYAIAGFLDRPESVGLIVVKDDSVRLEHYATGNDRDSRWVSFSVAKSVTSLLIGAAIADGFIRSLDEPVAHYLPRLRGTPYESATIRNVLNMASGVAWNEDYADRNSDVAQAGGLNGPALVRYLAALPSQVTPGTRFNYNTGETNLAGEILRAAIGNNAATYLTHKIWQPFGMETNATWLTSGEGGGETGGCCISATLRDYARIGLFAMRDGVLLDGTRILPEGWMRESTTPSRGSAEYGYLWWLAGDGSYSALGIFGQQIFIDPARNLVIAANSNAPTAVDSEYVRHLRAVIQSLRATF